MSDVGRKRRVGVRRLLGLLAGTFGAQAIWLAATANWTLGTALVGVVAVVLATWAAWWPRLVRRRWLAGLTAALAVGVLGTSGFLAVYGLTDTTHGDEDAIIVLGAAVHGRELSRTLQARLEVALDYHARNPDALIVVSGGQGPQEDLPEAEAMRAFLVDHGVPPDRILTEARSTSTDENFDFSKAVLDARLRPGYRVAFATQEFHVYRAERIATAHGLDVTHVSARTPWYFWAPNYLRETVVVAGSWLGR